MPVGSSIFVCGRHYNGSTSTIFGIYPRWTHAVHFADLKTSTSTRTFKLDDGPLRIHINMSRRGRSVSYCPIRMNSALASPEGQISFDRLLREEGTIYVGADVLGVVFGYRCPFQRQINHKSSPYSLLAFHFDPTAVILDDPLTNRQA